MVLKHDKIALPCSLPPLPLFPSRFLSRWTSEKSKQNVLFLSISNVFFWMKRISFLWLVARQKSHLIGCLTVGTVQIHCSTSPAACPTAVLSHLPCLLSSITSVRHVCRSSLSVTSVPHICPSRLSVMSVRHVFPSHLSVTSIRHISLSCLSITFVCHICLSHMSVMSVHYVYPLHLSFMYARHICPSHPSVMFPSHPSVHQSVHHVCPSCLSITSVGPSRQSFKSIHHVCLSHLSFPPSVMSACQIHLTRLSVTSIPHVCPSCQSLMSVFHIHLSCPSVVSVHHVCPSCLSIMSVHQVCLSCLSIMSVCLSHPSVTLWPNTEIFPKLSILLIHIIYTYTS